MKKVPASEYEKYDKFIKDAEPCDDAVSREAVLDKINNIGVNGFVDYNSYSEMFDFVDTLPPVTPKPKIGHWIMTHDYYTGAYETIDYVKCSNCHENSLEEGNYCPNCGARMEGELYESN